MTDIEVGPFRGTVVRMLDGAGQTLEYLRVVHCLAPLEQIALLPLIERDLETTFFLWFAAAGRSRDLMEDLETLAEHALRGFWSPLVQDYEGYVCDVEDEDEDDEEETDWRENYEQDEQIMSGFMNYLKKRPKPPGGD